MAQEVILKAPLSGVLTPLEDVPDEVFASKMVGDGISIDPTSQSLLAPCAGRVTMVHPAGHALTITHASGLEVLMHVGLDTVALKDGFRPRVAAPQEVKEGDVLLEFDADEVALRARSLLTEILVTNVDRVDVMERSSGLVSAGRDTILRVRLKDGVGAVSEAAAAAGGAVSAPVTVPNPLGLHARPAAVLVGVAKRFTADVEVLRGDGRANAKSVVSLMTLQVANGDVVRFSARGTDAAEAVEALAKALAGGLGEDIHAGTAGAVAGAGVAGAGVAGASLPGSSAAAAGAGVAESVATGETDASAEDGLVLRGVSAAPGLAVGRIFQHRRRLLDVPESAADSVRERHNLERALDQARAELDDLQARLSADPEHAAIFAAHRELLDDPDLIASVWPALASGKSAARAWKDAYTTQAGRLAALPNPLLAGRANDLRDVGERVLRHLLGEAEDQIEVPSAAEGKTDVCAGWILVAEDLTPSQTATLDRTKILGFATQLGGATSHVAILAKSMDLPAVAAMDPRVADVAVGTMAVLDGTAGTLRVDPPASVIDSARAAQRAHAGRRAELLAHADEPAVTRDGRSMEVVANLGSADEAEPAVKMGAEGVGLLRSEFLFMDRPSAPSEDEQAAIYRSIAQALGPKRRFIIRTLDVGGDKPLSYLPIGSEANPFLGERGIRVSLNRPELLRTQFRAILRAAGLANLGVMLPMVTTLDEFRRARDIFEAERAALQAPDIPLGIMIEVPAAAITADILAREAAFFSIGTNDLTQYVLAVDRGHPRLAAMADGLHPAVLRLISKTVEAAHAHGRWVGVCGGIAGDPQAVPILLGLGVDELSVAVPSVPAVKAAIRELDSQKCKSLADQAQAQDSATAVRALVGQRA